MGSDTGEGTKEHPPPCLENRISEETTKGKKSLEQGDTAGALKHFQTALEKAESLSEGSSMKISSLMNCGSCLVTIGEPDRGLRLLESALHALENKSATHATTEGKQDDCEENETTEVYNKEDQTMHTDLLYDIAIAAQTIGDLSKAEATFKRCIGLHMKSGNRIQAADVFCALANCHRLRNEVEDQVTCLVSAKRLLGEAGEESREAILCVELCLVYYHCGRSAESEELLATAKMMALRIANPKDQS